MSAEKEAALADGQVDHDEYVAGYGRFKACLAERGFELIDEEERDGRMHFALLAEAVDTGDEPWCYYREWRAIDMEWQGSL